VQVTIIAISIYYSADDYYLWCKVGKSGVIDHSHTMQHTNK